MKTTRVKLTLITLATALALSALAGCDRKPEERAKATPPPTSSAGTGGTANTPSTPANAGTPSEPERKTGSNPVQGQVDPKQGEQHRDFQHRGDGAGPKKPGG
jgi:hypothetical protein